MADYYAILHSATGNILGISSFQPLPDNIPNEYEIKGFLGDFPRSLSLWDSNLREFIKGGVDYYPLTKLQFLERFTTQERIAIRSSTDPIVIDFMDLLTMSQEVDLINPSVTLGLQYLASINLIQSSRIAEILRI